MRLWRLTRAPFVALDGAGAMMHGTRYAPPGHPVVSLASEAGLAVLVALRYQPRDLAGIPDDFVLGWTEVKATPLRAPDEGGEDGVRAFVGDWLDNRRSLLVAVRSRVLPETDVVLLNPRHPQATQVPPLTTRPFSFAECLHEPPMLASFQEPS
jgi:RES domain-containing protein